jgi:hypothetical protein
MVGTGLPVRAGVALSQFGCFQKRDDGTVTLAGSGVFSGGKTCLVRARPRNGGEISLAIQPTLGPEPDNRGTIPLEIIVVELLKMSLQTCETHCNTLYLKYL